MSGKTKSGQLWGLRKSIYKEYMKNSAGGKESFFKKLWIELDQDIRADSKMNLRPTYRQRIETTKKIPGKKFTHTREGHTATFEITPDGKFLVPDGTEYDYATKAVWEQYRGTSVKNPGNNAWKEAKDDAGMTIDDYWRDLK